MRKNGMYGGNVETIAVNEIYKVFVSIWLVEALCYKPEMAAP
jgi:hypothetical protein